MDYDAVFTAYYTLFRADSDIPTSSDDEYTVGMRLANEAINYWSNYDGTYWKELFTTNQLDNSSGTQTISTGVTVYTAPANFREAGGNVRVKDSSGNTLQTYPIADPNQVQFLDTHSTFAYFRPNLTYYSTGTASQSTTTITGSGTTWTSAMTGMTIEFVTGETATITYASATTLTASVSQTVASGTYRIISTGTNLVINPAPTSALNGLDVDYDYYKKPTLFTTGVSKTEMADPYFIVNRMLAQQFRAARNPYYTSALKDSENTIRVMQIDNNSGNWANPWTVADNSGAQWGS